MSRCADDHDGFSLALQLFDVRGGGQQRDLAFFKQPGVADQELFAVAAGLGATARQGLKISRRDDRMSLLPGGLNNRVRQGVLRSGFDIGGQS